MQAYYLGVINKQKKLWVSGFAIKKKLFVLVFTDIRIILFGDCENLAREFTFTKYLGFWKRCRSIQIRILPNFFYIRLRTFD